MCIWEHLCDNDDVKHTEYAMNTYEYYNAVQYIIDACFAMPEIVTKTCYPQYLRKLISLCHYIRPIKVFNGQTLFFSAWITRIQLINDSIPLITSFWPIVILTVD